MTDAVAYFWSAKIALDGEWRTEVERFVGAVSGIALAIEESEDVSIKLADGVHETVELHFAHRRGGGTVSRTAGARLILVSLGVAARLKLDLSDANGEALALSEPRALLSRIPFTESADEVEALAEEVGWVLRRVRLEALAPSPHGPRYGGVFFA
jgi:hypothetical protein